MAEWKCVDAWELGRDFECPCCHRSVLLRWGGSVLDLPPECPKCGADLSGTERSERDDRS